MRTDASWQQAANLLTLVSNKGTPAGQIQRLYSSGLLADLLDANVDEVNRDEFRRVLGLGPVCKIVPFEKKLEPVPDTLIRVSRSIRPVYPDWVKTVMHPEFESTGPAEYDLGQVELWLHDGQKNDRYMEGNKLYEYLKEQKMLEICLSLRDGEEIQKKGPTVFRKFFRGPVFLWKSIVQNRDDDLLVPYLTGGGDEVAVSWNWLGNGWYGGNPALRFAS